MPFYNFIKIIKKLFRRFNILNIILLTIFSILIFSLFKIWTPSKIPEEKKYSDKISLLEGDSPVDITRGNLPSSSSYESIPQKNLFRPDRKEWEPLPPPPPPSQTPPPPPTPPPDLKLHGVIILGGDRNVALMSGSYISGENKVDLKVQRFYVNQLIAEYRIIDITEDKTTLKKEGGKDVLTIPLLRGGIRTDILSAIKKQATVDDDKKKENSVINLSMSSGIRTTLLQPSEDGIIRLSRLEPKFSISNIQQPPGQQAAGQQSSQHISGAVTAQTVQTLAGGIDTTIPKQHVSGSVTIPPSTIITGQGIGPPPTPPQHISGVITGR